MNIIRPPTGIQAAEMIHGQKKVKINCATHGFSVPLYACAPCISAMHTSREGLRIANQTLLDALESVPATVNKLSSSNIALILALKNAQEVICSEMCTTNHGPSCIDAGKAIDEATKVLADTAPEPSSPEHHSV